MAKGKGQMAKIEGWGADLDPANRPAVPMEKPSEVLTARGKVPERQVAKVKIYRSVEYPDLTPVFGTSCPPSGLSGKLRGIAYRYSEGQLAHWLTLLAADRVNVIEGVLDDLVKGRYPKRRGLLAAGLGVGALGLGVFLIRRARRAA